MPSPESLVILLHGVGADAANLVPLGEALKPMLPRAVFAAPDAPLSGVAQPSGRSTCRNS